MAYRTLRECVDDLLAHGMLRVIEEEIDPRLEMGMIQRRALRAKAPALLFARPKNCAFPMLANLFGTMERLEFIFRDSLSSVKRLFEITADPASLAARPFSALPVLKSVLKLRPIRKKASPRDVPVLANTCKLSDLPRLVSWPEDGGPFATLPLVYSEAPEKPGAANLGMYRVQLAGNEYGPDEAGLHYQIYRGIGPHHAQALARGRTLPVHIYIGGPPALTLAAVMPLPANMSELMFAGLLGGRRVELARCGLELPALSQADFLIQAGIGAICKPEGPFGDHLGYYSMRHLFPVAKVRNVYHRNNAIWPFTTVGRPPQEDTVFGAFIHELTRPLVAKVFEGVKEVHAVDAAGVHPLLLAIGKERYTPYKLREKPQELLTQAFGLLGKTQTSLAKYLLIVSEEDAPALTAADIPGFFEHLLERTNFARDLHFICNASCDTLDYCGGALNEGSRLVWAAAGEPRRSLGMEIKDFPDLPRGFSRPKIFAKGILLIGGSAHSLAPGVPDSRVMDELCPALLKWPERESFPLAVIADDPDFSGADWDNFLWTCFTRSDPATDVYGAGARVNSKHWQCEAPLVIDARAKKFHAPPLEEDPLLVERLKKLARGPLAGIL